MLLCLSSAQEANCVFIFSHHHVAVRMIRGQVILPTVENELSLDLELSYNPTSPASPRDGLRGCIRQVG